MPKVSVVIPSYNHAAFIAQAVHSVSVQTWVDLEIVVVDDGSTDDTLAVLERMHEPRMRVITQSNQDAHAAINRGLAEATGDYLAILNSDDEYLPTRLEKLVGVLQSNPNIGLVGSYIEIIDKEGRTLGVKHGYHDLEPWALESPEKSFRAGTDLRAALLTENYFSASSNYVFTREWFKRAGNFRKLRYAHDWDFALRMARLAQLSLVPEPLIRYRVHARNTIRENQARMIFEICWILAVNLPKHVEDAWFDECALPVRIDQLLHSVYTFNCDRVLAMMLLQKLSDDLPNALQLLETDDPTRVKYLHFIEERLAQASQELANRPAVENSKVVGKFSSVRQWMSRLKTRIN